MVVHTSFSRVCSVPIQFVIYFPHKKEMYAYRHQYQFEFSSITAFSAKHEDRVIFGIDMNGVIKSPEDETRLIATYNGNCTTMVNIAFEYAVIGQVPRAALSGSLRFSFEWSRFQKVLNEEDYAWIALEFSDDLPASANGTVLQNIAQLVCDQFG